MELPNQTLKLIETKHDQHGWQLIFLYETNDMFYALCYSDEKQKYGWYQDERKVDKHPCKVYLFWLARDPSNYIGFAKRKLCSNVVEAYNLGIEANWNPCHIASADLKKGGEELIGVKTLTPFLKLIPREVVVKEALFNSLVARILVNSIDEAAPDSSS